MTIKFEEEDLKKLLEISSPDELIAGLFYFRAELIDDAIKENDIEFAFEEIGTLDEILILSKKYDSDYDELKAVYDDLDNDLKMINRNET